MITAAEALFQQLLTRIKDRSAEPNVLPRSEKIVEEITEVLIRLKELIKQEGFADEPEEIHFYRHIKPKFHALYIYHATIFNVESDKPLGSKKACRRYFHSELRRIDSFLYHHLELHKYYHSGKTHLDKAYFTRGQAFPQMEIDIASPIIDREFCTLHSIKVSFLLAYEELKEYFQNRMLEIETPKDPVFAEDPEPLIWTDAKVGLVELAYSLHAKGSFNHGKADLSQIVAHLEKDWHVELGNTSRTFQEVLSRQKGIASFLEKLKKALWKRNIENSDE